MSAPIIAQLEARPHLIERGRTKVRLTRLRPVAFAAPGGTAWFDRAWALKQREAAGQ